jgi:hypothetical protein
LRLTRDTVPAELATARELLPLERIDRSGAIATSDGAYVRVLQVTPLDLAALTSDERNEAAERFAGLVARLDDRCSLQVFVESTPVDVGTLGPAPAGDAAARLAHAHAGSLLSESGSRKAVGVGAYVIVAHRSERGRPPRRWLTMHRERLAASLLLTERVRRDAAAAGLCPRLLDGTEVVHLLRRRVGAGTQGPPTQVLEIHGELDADLDADEAAHAVRALHDGLATAAVDLTSPDRIDLGPVVEQVLHLDPADDAAGFGWLVEALPVDAPFSLAVHLGRAEGEARMAIYLALRAAASAGAVELAEEVDALTRRLVSADCARVDRGKFEQPSFWRSSLPIAWDEAGRMRTCSPRLAGETAPLALSWCASPSGTPFAINTRAETVARLDLSGTGRDATTVVISGADPCERVVAANVVLTHALAQGATGWVVDRSGGRGFLARLLGAVVTPADEAGGVGQSDVLRRLHDLLVDENADLATLAALLSGATNSPAGASAIVDLHGVADDLVPAATLIAAERAVSALSSQPPARSRTAPRGVLVLDEVERLLALPPARRWLAGLARRTTSLDVLLVGVVNDVAACDARSSAFLRRSEMKLLLRHEGAGLDAAHDVLGLRRGEAAALAELDAMHAYWIDGARTRGHIAIPLGAAARWMLAPDALDGDGRRAAALSRNADDAWAAIDTLRDEQPPALRGAA